MDVVGFESILDLLTGVGRVHQGLTWVLRYWAPIAPSGNWEDATSVIGIYPFPASRLCSLTGIYCGHFH